MATIEDFNPGDPALIIGGKPEEQPAKKHAPQPPKPNKTARGIHADIKHRIQEIEPQLDALVKEHAMLQQLDFIFSGGDVKQLVKPARKPAKKSGKAKKQ